MRVTSHARLARTATISAAAALVVAALAPAAIAKPPGGGGGGTSYTSTPYSGEAYNLKANLLNLIDVDPFTHARLTNSDLDGIDDWSLVKVDQSLAPLPVSVKLGILDASVYGTSNTTVAFADVVGNGKSLGAQGPAEVRITTPGGDIVVKVRVLSAEARSTCVNGAAVGSYDVSAADLDILLPGAPPISVHDPIPDTTIPLGPLGYVAFGEHSFSGSTQKATGLHILVTGIAEVVISHAEATINCSTPPPPQCLVKDWVTGGGWIGDRATFGFNGGQKPNGLHGHLTFIDHQTGQKITGTAVTAYEVLGTTKRKVTYSGNVDGTPATIVWTVADNGEPGGGADTVDISTSTGYSSGEVTLSNGNVQLHKPGGCSKRH